MHVIAMGPRSAKAPLKKSFVPVMVSFSDSDSEGLCLVLSCFQHRLSVGYLGAGGSFMPVEGGQGSSSRTGSGSLGTWWTPLPPPLASEGSILRGGL